MKSPIIADDLNGYLKFHEIFGLQFFSLKAVTHENIKQSLSFWRKGQVLLLMALFSLFGVIVFFSTLTHKGTGNVLTVFYHESINYLMLIIFWTNLFQSLRSTTQIKQFFSNLQFISDSCTQHFDLKMNFVDVRKNAIRKLWISLLALIVTNGISTYFRSKTYTDFLLAWAIQATFIGFIAIIFIKYTFYVCFVNYQLRFLHKLLHVCFEDKSGGSKLMMKRLLVVWKIYNKIIENGSLVNETSGITILLILIDNILIITYVGYGICNIVLDGLHSQELARKPISLIVLCEIKTLFFISTEPLFLFLFASFNLYSIFRCCHGTRKLVMKFFSRNKN